MKITSPLKMIYLILMLLFVTTIISQKGNDPSSSNVEDQTPDPKPNPPTSKQDPSPNPGPNPTPDPKPSPSMNNPPVGPVQTPDGTKSQDDPVVYVSNVVETTEIVVKNQKTSKSFFEENKSAILGGSISGGIVLILIFAFIIYKIRQSNRRWEDEEYLKSSNNPFKSTLEQYHSNHQ